MTNDYLAIKVIKMPLQNHQKAVFIR